MNMHSSELTLSLAPVHEGPVRCEYEFDFEEPKLRVGRFAGNQYAAILCDGKTIWHFDVATGLYEKLFPNELNQVVCGATRFALLYNDGVLHVYDAKDFSTAIFEQQTGLKFDQENPVRLTLSTDEKYVIVSSMQGTYQSFQVEQSLCVSISSCLMFENKQHLHYSCGVFEKEFVPTGVHAILVGDKLMFLEAAGNCITISGFDGNIQCERIKVYDDNMNISALTVTQSGLVITGCHKYNSKDVKIHRLNSDFTLTKLASFQPTALEGKTIVHIDVSPDEKQLLVTWDYTSSLYNISDVTSPQVEGYFSGIDIVSKFMGDNHFMVATPDTMNFYQKS